jgi:hypothetical protein
MTKPGVGLDVGTMNFVSARYTPSGTEYKRITDAYIDLDVENVKTLKMSGINYVEFKEQKDVVVVLGEKSFQMANLFKQEVKRPLSKGLISPGALRAQYVLTHLVTYVLEKPAEEKEHCFFSIPADPIDLPDQDAKFHKNLFTNIIAGLGYTPHPMNEAMAIIFSQCEEDSYSGISMSFGSGLCNVATAYMGVMGLNFSIAQGGGDWIDIHAAKATGSTAARMCSLKEKGGFSVNNPPKDKPDQEAIALYVRTLIRHCLEEVAKKLKQEQNDHLEGLPLVISGGTTLADDFMDVFKDEYNSLRKRGQIPPVARIIKVERPLDAVADGLLALAHNEYT